MKSIVEAATATWYAAAAHTRLTPGSFNNRKTEKLDTLTPGHWTWRGGEEAREGPPVTGMRREEEESANLV